MLPAETHIRSKDTNRLKLMEWKKVFHANGNKKKHLYQTTQTFKQTVNKK